MNFRIITLFVLTCFLHGSLFAQKKQDYSLVIKKKEFKTEAEEGFVEAWKNVQAGNGFFDAGKGTYDLARDQYLLAYQYNSEHPVLNYKIGVCYLFTDNKYEALSYLRKAYDKYPDLHPEINYHLGRAYHLVLEFDKAIEHYAKFREKAVDLGNVTGAIEVDKRVIECNNGKKIIEEPYRVIIANLGDSINSVYDDYSPVFTRQDSVLYFTSRRFHTRRNKRSPYDNKYFEDIYVSELLEDGKWSGAQPLPGKVNTSGNDAIAGAAPDGKTLYIYNGKSNSGDILISDWNPKKNVWKRPGKISSRLRSDQAEGSVFFTQTGDTIYFISADEKLTQGGKDIMISVRDSKGRWRDPENLGSLVNSKYNEEGIFLTPDGKEMFFSSQGHNSMGGYDVFYTYKQDDGTWADPENIGYPVNTPDDDLFFRLSANGKHAYYSSIREGGVGAKDIYKITFLGSEKELMILTEDILTAALPDTLKKGFFTMPEEISIDSFYYLKGKVTDKETGEPLLAKLEFIDIDNSVVIATALSADSGNYSVRFPAPRTYGVEIVVKDYLFYLDIVDLSKEASDEVTIKDFQLEKIQVGTKVVLENIYFETGKAILKPESFKQLDQVIEFMESNETLRMEISGHTDNTGSMKVNSKLSEDRAKAVVDYLTGKGIAMDRLEWKGYAYTQPIAPNDTAEGRAKNRRVEFKILSK